MLLLGRTTGVPALNAETDTHLALHWGSSSCAGSDASAAGLVYAGVGAMLSLMLLCTL